MSVDEHDFDDPWADFDVTLSIAYHASLVAAEDVDAAEAAYGSLPDDATNHVASSGRRAVATLIERMRATYLDVSEGLNRTAEANKAGEMTSASKEATFTTNAASDIRRLLEEVRVAVNAASTPDVTPAEITEADLPDTNDWAATCVKVQHDVLAWELANRGNTGKLLILRPSPACGKTRSQILVALDAQKARKKVVYAARTKEMLDGELKRRFEKQRYAIRLHVITGRDENNCPNFANVKAVQAHGYSPGRAVCFLCPRHPRNAKWSMSQPCDYFLTRIRAQIDTQHARRGVHEYPIILTTHAALVAAIDGGGGMYSKFWAADLMLVDEDPTEAFEPTSVLTEEHLDYESDEPSFVAVSRLASILRECLSLARSDRQIMQGHNFKRMHKGQLVPDKVHTRLGSTYAGQDLHHLIERACSGATARHLGIKSAINMLRNAADASLTPMPGEFLGCTTATEINDLYPHKGLIPFAEAVFQEVQLAHQLGVQLFPQVRGKDISDELRGRAENGQHLTPEKVIAENIDVRTSYQTRLEIDTDGRCKFILQDFIDSDTATANVIVGDAYADDDHYRQLFFNPGLDLVDPNRTTVVAHVAHFPVGSVVWRLRSHAGISHLREGGWYEHTTIIAEVLRQLAGKRVLVYGHKALKIRFTEFMEKNQDFGLAEWAYEHWWGGRGKDQYKDFDAVVSVSEPIQNIDGMLHVVNARAFRDARRYLSTDTARAMDCLSRVTFDPARHGIAHTMRNPKTHWRVRQEHRRQNVNEQAQAMHRVRGLIEPKVMVITGNEVELTRDTIAASTTLDDHCLTDATPSAFITADEALVAMLAVIDQLGCWCSLFAHALLSHAVRRGVTHRGLIEGVEGVGLPTVGGISSGIGQISTASDSAQQSSHLGPIRSYRDREDSTHRIGPRWYDGNDERTGPSILDAVDRVLVLRVWTPPPRWELLSKYATQNVSQVRRAHDMLAKLATHCGTLTPSWAPVSSHGGLRGVTWYTTATQSRGFETAHEIINDQYGPSRLNSVEAEYVDAPRRRPFVPF